jgi:hypothetical protein
MDVAMIQFNPSHPIVSGTETAELVATYLPCPASAPGAGEASAREDNIWLAAPTRRNPAISGRVAVAGGSALAPSDDG